MKIIAFTLLYVTVVSTQFPSFIKLCKRDSNLNECLKNNINEAKGHLKTGIPSLFVAKCQPFMIDSDLLYAISPTLKYTQKKGFIYSGMDSYNIEKVNLDLERNILQIDWVWEYLDADGDYELKGKMMNFDVDGRGKCLTRVANFGVSLTMTGERTEKEGKDYIIFNNNKVKFDLSKLKSSIYFGGLFPTAEQNEAVMKWMNENDQVAISQFQPNIEELLVGVATNCVKKLFETYSIDELFPI